MRLRALEWRKRAIWNGTDASSGIDHYEVRADDARALYQISQRIPMAKLKATTLRLPEEVDRKLDMAVKNGKAATKIEIVRRAIDEFVENHAEMFI